MTTTAEQIRLYKNYLGVHPDSEIKDELEQRIAALEDDFINDEELISMHKQTEHEKSN